MMMMVMMMVMITMMLMTMKGALRSKASDQTSLDDNTCCKKSRLIICLLEDSDEQIKQQNIGHQQKQSHDDSHQCATKFIMTGGVESCGFLIYKKKMLENLASTLTKRIY